MIRFVCLFFVISAVIFNSNAEELIKEARNTKETTPEPPDITKEELLRFVKEPPDITKKELLRFVKLDPRMKKIEPSNIHSAALPPEDNSTRADVNTTGKSPVNGSELIGAESKILETETSGAPQGEPGLKEGSKTLEPSAALPQTESDLKKGLETLQPPAFQGLPRPGSDLNEETLKPRYIRSEEEANIPLEVPSAPKLPQNIPNLANPEPPQQEVDVNATGPPALARRELPEENSSNATTANSTQPSLGSNLFRKLQSPINNTSPTLKSRRRLRYHSNSTSVSQKTENKASDKDELPINPSTSRSVHKRLFPLDLGFTSFAESDDDEETEDDQSGKPGNLADMMNDDAAFRANRACCLEGHLYKTILMGLIMMAIKAFL